MCSIMRLFFCEEQNVVTACDADNRVCAKGNSYLSHSPTPTGAALGIVDYLRHSFADLDPLTHPLDF